MLAENIWKSKYPQDFSWGYFKLFHVWYSKQRQMQTISVLYDYTAKNQESASKIINDLKDIILV